MVVFPHRQLPRRCAHPAATGNDERVLSSAPALAKLDKFDGLILDDLDYVRKDQAETAVLFELVADDEVCVGDLYR